ncbi:MAG: phosphate starvation-inducible protein PhoH [Gammaproteobacteria bacterium]|nr:phosphate starvation-inducible protein PhoH [Gammaproteobacteria bacterium]
MNLNFKKQEAVIQAAGDTLGNIFHYISLFIIGATIVWSAAHEYMRMIESGYAGLKDILLLFIYLELGAMVGIYFKTHHLPVQYLIYIAITALARHLVIDMQKVSDPFHLYLILAIVGSILLLSISILVFAYTARSFGRPEDEFKIEPAAYSGKDRRCSTEDTRSIKIERRKPA